MVSTASGYDIEIGSASLTFPLRLKIRDFSISKNDSIYIEGKSVNADISLLPLFRGDVEINHLSFEKIGIHTRDMISTARIDGKVGYARLVARDADLTASVADIRQLQEILKIRKNQKMLYRKILLLKTVSATLLTLLHAFFLNI